MLFWRFVLIMLIFGVMSAGSTYLIRKYFKVESLSWWGHNYVNDEHRRFDQMLRTISVVWIIIGTIVNISRDVINQLWYFQTGIIVFIMIVLGQFLRAYMEKKYKENENYYKASIVEAFVLIIILFITYQTNFYGLLL